MKDGGGGAVRILVVTRGDHFFSVLATPCKQECMDELTIPGKGFFLGMSCCNHVLGDKTKSKAGLDTASILQ